MEFNLVDMKVLCIITHLHASISKTPHLHSSIHTIHLLDTTEPKDRTTATFLRHQRILNFKGMKKGNIILTWLF